MKIDIEQLKQATLIKFKRGYTYLLAVDETKFTVDSITHIIDYLEDQGITVLAISVEGDPNTAISMFEVKENKHERKTSQITAKEGKNG